MSGRAVDKVRTYATVTEALRALSDGHLLALGRRPTVARLVVLLAQSAHETGRWQRFFNWNPGGVKASTRGKSDYVAAMTREVLDGKEVELSQHFAAYPDLTAGMAAWCHHLNDRHAKALARADAYDPVGYVRELKKGRYFTDHEEAYAASVRSLAAEYSHLPVMWHELADPDPGETAALLAIRMRIA